MASIITLALTLLTSQDEPEKVLVVDQPSDADELEGMVNEAGIVYTIHLQEPVTIHFDQELAGHDPRYKRKGRGRHKNRWS